MSWKLGDRVVTPGGDVGHIEEFDDDIARVRLLTPKNEPSVCSSWCWLVDLKDGTNILPQPRSKEWFRQSAMFMLAVTGALKEAGV
jgi:hypothetical protein